MNKPRAGFLLSRHWRDTPQGTEITLWLATDSGAQRVVLPAQESVTFIPVEYQAQVESLLQDERQLRIQPLQLKDFRRRPVFGLYCRQHRQLQWIEKKLRENGIPL